MGVAYLLFLKRLFVYIGKSTPFLYSLATSLNYPTKVYANNNILEHSLLELLFGLFEEQYPGINLSHPKLKPNNFFEVRKVPTSS